MHVLDIYDDPRGEILVGLLGNHPLPEKLASARLLASDELAVLPDRLFALVADTESGRLRKYAMCDEAHMSTSILYFLDRGQTLPEEVQSKVAANLVNACAWYDLDPPEPLVKRAMVGRAFGMVGAAMDVKDLGAKKDVRSTRERQSFDAFRRAQVSGAKMASGREVEFSMEDEKAVVEDRSPGKVMQIAATLAQREASTTKLDRQTKAEPIKQADLNGTEIMPHGTLSKSVRSNPSKHVSTAAKVSAALPTGYQEIGTMPEVMPVVKRAEYEHFAMPLTRSYPIDTVEQVKQAAAYFDEHVTEFGLMDRRVYSQALHLQAGALGVKVGGATLKYAGEDYGPYLTAELGARERGFVGTGHEQVYALLQEKRASTAPPVMVEMLKAADANTGADRSYGRPGVGYRDPYQAVYGKVAQEADLKEEDTFSWAEGTEYVSGPQLVAFASTNPSLDELFGKGFAAQFAKDPVGIFKSLPDPQKMVLSRMAADNSGTTSRI